MSRGGFREALAAALSLLFTQEFCQLLAIKVCLVVLLTLCVCVCVLVLVCLRINKSTCLTVLLAASYDDLLLQPAERSCSIELKKFHRRNVSSDRLTFTSAGVVLSRDRGHCLTPDFFYPSRL